MGDTGLPYADDDKHLRLLNGSVSAKICLGLDISYSSKGWSSYPKRSGTFLHRNVHISHITPVHTYG